MKALRPRDPGPDSLDMNIALALCEDVVTSRDPHGGPFLLDIRLEHDHSSITIRSHDSGVLQCSEVDGPLYEAFPKAVRDAFHKWKEHRSIVRK